MNYICLYDWSNIIETFYTASQPNKIDYGFFSNFPSLPLKAAVDLQDLRKWWSKIGSQCDRSKVESTKQPPHTREVSAANQHTRSSIPSNPNGSLKELQQQNILLLGLERPRPATQLKYTKPIIPAFFLVLGLIVRQRQEKIWLWIIIIYIIYIYI